MSATLIFRVDGVGHQIALEPSHAPKTLAKVIAALPAKVDVHCAKIAGSHIMWPVPVVERAEKASDVLAMPPGAFFFWPERQYLEITYDALQAETAAVSYLGRLTDDMGWLREYADRQRRTQGREVFTAEIFMAEGRPVPSSAPIAGTGAWARLQDARRRAWQNQPPDVQALLDRRGLNLPFGPLAMAEAELRKLHELIWRLWNEAERRSDPDKISIATFALEAAITRVGGFCHMLSTAAVLQDGIECLTNRQVPIEEALVELIFFVGRMAAWLDLYICWWPMNEITLAAQQEQRSPTTEV